MKTEGSCPICLEALGSSDRWSSCSRKQHIFHYECLAQWVLQSYYCASRNKQEICDRSACASCPICREPLSELVANRDGSNRDERSVLERLLWKLKLVFILKKGRIIEFLGSIVVSLLGFYKGLYLNRPWPMYQEIIFCALPFKQKLMLYFAFLMGNFMSDIIFALKISNLRATLSC